MKKLTKAIAMILIGTMLVSTTAFAAPYEEASVDGVELRETQTIDSYKLELKSCSSSKGQIDAIVLCDFVAQWNEGIDGWINSAKFTVRRAWIDDVECAKDKIVISGGVERVGSSMYQNYQIDGEMVRLSITIDEWGNVTMEMVQA